MPEGPEAKYLELMMRQEVLGMKFNKITSNTKTTKNIPSAAKIIDTGSKGKILWLKTKKYWVHLHMGLTGWLVFDKPRIYKYILHFRDQDGEKFDVYLADRRRFSRIDIFTTDKTHKNALNKIGICLFCSEFTVDKFKELMGNSKRNISAFLLDQKKFAGIGNYIRNDALYIAKISPKRKLHQLNDQEINKLYQAIKFIVYSSLYTWLKDDKIPIPAYIKKLAPKKLNVPYQMKVYDQEFDPSGREVKFIKNYAGRRTFYVPSIQK